MIRSRAEKSIGAAATGLSIALCLLLGFTLLERAQPGTGWLMLLAVAPLVLNHIMWLSTFRFNVDRAEVRKCCESLAKGYVIVLIGTAVSILVRHGGFADILSFVASLTCIASWSNTAEGFANWLILRLGHADQVVSGAQPSASDLPTLT